MVCVSPLTIKAADVIQNIKSTIDHCLRECNLVSSPCRLADCRPARVTIQPATNKRAQKIRLSRIEKSVNELDATDNQTAAALATIIGPRRWIAVDPKTTPSKKSDPQTSPTAHG